MRQRRFKYGSDDPCLKCRFACSNEPCVDDHKKARWELAHIRDFLWSDTYGECRDNRKLRSSAAICRHGSLRRDVAMRGRPQEGSLGACSHKRLFVVGHIQRMPRQSQAAKQRSDLSAWVIAWEGSHAQTGWQVDSESLLSAGRLADWTHTANAATIASCEAAQRSVGMGHCVGRKPCAGWRHMTKGEYFGEDK